MTRDANEHGVNIIRVSLENLFNLPEEDETMEEASLKNLGPDVAGVSQTRREDSGLEEPEEDLALTAAQKLKFLARACSNLESRGELNKAGRKVYSSCQRALCFEEVEFMKRTTIFNHCQRKKKLLDAVSTRSYPVYKHSIPFSREPWL